MVGLNPGVDDIGIDARGRGVIGVGARKWQVALVDQIEPPRRACLSRVDRRFLIRFNVIDVRVVLKCIELPRVELGCEAVQCGGVDKLWRGLRSGCERVWVTAFFEYDDIVIGDNLAACSNKRCQTWGWRRQHWADDQGAGQREKQERQLTELSFHCGFFLLNVETSERVVSFISIASKRDMSVI